MQQNAAFGRFCVVDFRPRPNKQRRNSHSRARNKRHAGATEEYNVRLTRGICLPGTPEYYRRQFVLSQAEVTPSLGSGENCLHHSKSVHIEPMSSKVIFEDKPTNTEQHKLPLLRGRTEMDRIVAEYRASLSPETRPRPETTRLPLIKYDSQYQQHKYHQQMLRREDNKRIIQQYLMNQPFLIVPWRVPRQ